MTILWQYGQDAEGHWMCATGETHVPSIHWRDTDPPQRFEHLARQAREQAAQEAEQALRYQRMQRIHELQAEAYTAIAEVLALKPGEPTVTVVSNDAT